MSEPTSAKSVADALRNETPELDDIARARMERELLTAVRAGKRSYRGSPSRAFALGVAVTLAAAAVFVWLRSNQSPVDDAVALSFVSTRNGATVERGEIRQGGSVHTQTNETTAIRIRESEFTLAENSELQFEHVAVNRIAMALTSGTLSVAFHPRHRGEEHLSIQTPNARVEVIGTVFTVSLEPSGATRVRVQEGVVRVTESGHESALVRGGNEIRVGGVAVAVAPVARPASTETPAPSVETPAPAPETPHAPAPAGESAASRLARVEAMVSEGRVAEAHAELERMHSAPAPRAVTANVWNLLGDLDQGSRHYELAATEYAHAAELGANDAYWSLARVRDRYLHDPSGAIPAYESYLRVAPHGAEASLARARLCELSVTEHCSALSAGTPAGTVAP